MLQHRQDQLASYGRVFALRLSSLFAFWIHFEVSLTVVLLLCQCYERMRKAHYIPPCTTLLRFTEDWQKVSIYVFVVWFLILAKTSFTISWRWTKLPSGLLSLIFLLRHTWIDWTKRRLNVPDHAIEKNPEGCILKYYLNPHPEYSQTIVC